MNDTVIKVDNLSKLYHLGELHKQMNSFRDKVTSLFKNRGEKRKDETIWALKDVSFDVKAGEVVGIIGSNGAGKSTLLKILSRITKPTRGKAWIDGRLGSLLEVGTGFHPELTGRENIYLNGAILGMKNAEIKRKFDEIVAFADIEKFMDTPVKRYSSGMYVRLAFAVAAHLDPEILLVDEVLSVGDYKFQEKCLGKMQEVTGQGRTVLFVSHNMKAVSQICPRTILLADGRIQSDGDTATVIRQYTGGAGGDTAEVVWPAENAPGNHSVKLLGVHVRNKDDKVKSEFNYTEPIDICVTFLVLDDTIDLYLYMYLENEDGVFVLVTTTVNNNPRFNKGIHEARYTIAPHFLNEGRYFVRQVLFKEHALTSPENIAYVEYPASFTVDYSGKFTGGQMRKSVGVVRPDWDWQISEIGRN